MNKSLNYWVALIPGIFIFVAGVFMLFMMPGGKMWSIIGLIGIVTGSYYGEKMGQTTQIGKE